MRYSYIFKMKGSSLDTEQRTVLLLPRFDAFALSFACIFTTAVRQGRYLIFVCPDYLLILAMAQRSGHPDCIDPVL